MYTKSKLNWQEYRTIARNLKATKPGITPSLIQEILGYPHIEGKQIRITSDGKGGIKQRNVDAKRAMDIIRQIRIRQQTPKHDKATKTESKIFRDALRDAGYEVDHINEVALLGEQLERVKAIGGDQAVENALEILWGAGYATGNMKENLQGLSPLDNKAKRDEWNRLQRHLGLKEAENPSPSALRPDLIVTGQDLSLKKTSFPEETPEPLTKTATQTPYQAPALTAFPGNELRLPPMHTGHNVEQPNVPTVMSHENVSQLAEQGQQLLQVGQAVNTAYRVTKGIFDIGMTFAGPALGLNNIK